MSLLVIIVAVGARIVLKGDVVQTAFDRKKLAEDNGCNLRSVTIAIAGEDI